MGDKTSALLLIIMASLTTT